MATKQFSLSTKIVNCAIASSMLSEKHTDRGRNWGLPSLIPGRSFPSGSPGHRGPAPDPHRPRGPRGAPRNSRSPARRRRSGSRRAARGWRPGSAAGRHGPGRSVAHPQPTRSPRRRRRPACPSRFGRCGRRPRSRSRRGTAHPRSRRRWQASQRGALLILISNSHDAAVAENNRMIVATANRLRLSPTFKAMRRAANISMPNPTGMTSGDAANAGVNRRDTVG